MKDLSEKSASYYKQTQLYLRFAAAEDAPGKVLEVLKTSANNKKVLDFGCGSGKYLRLLSPIAKRLFGVDASRYQIALARKFSAGLSNVRVATISGERLSRVKETFDVIISSWVLGTIMDEAKRKDILVKMEKLLRSGGVILLVENNCGGEFEKVRGRVNDPLKRTEKYNHWLREQGFEIMKKVSTYFEFGSLKVAQEVFGGIWGKTVGKQIKHQKIEHKVVIFCKKI